MATEKIEKAKEIQDRLRSQVVLEDDWRELNLVAGVDASYDRLNSTAWGAAVVVDRQTLRVEDQAQAALPCDFPYVPGYLSFREVPVLLRCLEQLSIKPDVILCDGQGLAHPKRFGLACHLGVELDIPTVGVAKSRLIGEHRPVEQERGSLQPLVHCGEQVGVVLRTRTGVRPVFVSPGHLMGIQGAVRLVLESAPKFRLPEPVRLAHRLCSTQGGHGLTEKGHGQIEPGTL